MRRDSLPPNEINRPLSFSLASSRVLETSHSGCICSSFPSSLYPSEALGTPAIFLYVISAPPESTSNFPVLTQPPYRPSSTKASPSLASSSLTSPSLPLLHVPLLRCRPCAPFPSQRSYHWHLRRPRGPTLHTLSSPLCVTSAQPASTTASAISSSPTARRSRSVSTRTSFIVLAQGNLSVRCCSSGRPSASAGARVQAYCTGCLRRRGRERVGGNGRLCEEGERELVEHVSGLGPQRRASPLRHIRELFNDSIRRTRVARSRSGTVGSGSIRQIK